MCPNTGPLLLVLLAGCLGLCTGAAASGPFAPERFESGGGRWAAQGVAEAAAAEVAARLLESESIEITPRGEQHGHSKRGGSQSHRHGSGQHASAKAGRRPVLVRSSSGFSEVSSEPSRADHLHHTVGSGIAEKSGHRISQLIQLMDDKNERWDIKGTTDGSHGNDLVLFSDLADTLGNSSDTAESSGDDDDDDDDFDTEEEEDLITPPIVNITAEEDATVKEYAPPLKAANATHLKAEPDEPDIMKLADGIGSMAYVRSPAGSRQLNRELRRRLQLQDAATVLFLMVTFALTLLVSACSIYQVADDTSPAYFYSDPQGRQQRLISESREATAFLSAFSSTPQNCRLRIVGRHLDELEGNSAFRNWHARSMAARGLQATVAALLPVRPRRRRLPFDVALDLTPFITSSGLLLSDYDMKTLNEYIHASNPLQRLLLQKQVEWAHWEDVATNIRQRLKALGFPGDVDVYLEAYDEVLVYRNHKWANFVRSRATQALVAISVVGGIFWLPYLWLRMRTTKVQARFQVNLEPARYWDLVSDGLNAAWGFQSS